MNFENDPIADKVNQQMSDLKKKGVNLNGGSEYNRVFEAFYFIYEQIQTKYAEDLYRWVKASERLPDKEGDYFCTLKYFHSEEVKKVVVNYKAPFWKVYEENYVIEWLEQVPASPKLAVEGKSKAVDEIIKLAHDSRYSDMDKVLSKLGDDVLTKLKENPNHITAQLKEFNEQVSYNTGFHTGFTLGYHASTQLSNKEVQDMADALRDWCDFELNIGGVPIWKNKLDHWLLDNTRLISRSELTMVDNYIEENIIKPLAALSTRI